MSSLDARIDELYQRPLGEFVSARSELARSVARADAGTVKRLKKPTVVPWAVNQLYWHARPAYDRLVKSGARLRAAQIAGLKRGGADVRKESDAHRHAVVEAVRSAEQLARAAGMHPDPNALTQMLEAVSLATTLSEAPGRFTTALKPAGFEALAGVPVKPVREPVQPTEHKPRGPSPAERRRIAALKNAERILERARAGEARARAAWERAKNMREVAERNLQALGDEESR
jgi:hypothetical protein